MLEGQSPSRSGPSVWFVHLVVLVALTACAPALPGRSNAGISGPITEDMFLIQEGDGQPFSVEAEGTIDRFSSAVSSYYRRGLWSNPSVRRPALCTQSLAEDCGIDFVDPCGGGCQDDADRERFLRELETILFADPGSAFVRTQAVFAAIRLQRPETAERLAAGCEAAAAWWCAVALGHLHHRMGRTVEAVPYLRRGLGLAPMDIACRLEDVSSLMPIRHVAAYREAGCSGRERIHSVFWDLSDPLLASEVNERWVEHIARRWEFLLEEQLHLILGLRYYTGAEEFRDRMGPPNSWRRNGAFPSRQAVPYSFVPSDFPWIDIDSTVEYSLEARGAREGAALGHLRLAESRAQTARFFEGDGLVVAMAIEDGLGREGSQALRSLSALVPGENRRVVRSIPHGREGGALTISPDVHLVEFEARQGRYVVRSRTVVEPLPADRPIVSDVLLFSSRVDEAVLERGLDRPAAVASMLGSTKTRRLDVGGVYFEAYGLPPEAETSLSLSLGEIEPGGLAALARTIRRQAGPPTVRVDWVGHADVNGRMAESIGISLANLAPGEYRIRVDVGLRDGRTISGTRTVTLLPDND